MSTMAVADYTPDLITALELCVELLKTRPLFLDTEISAYAATAVKLSEKIISSAKGDTNDF